MFTPNPDLEWLDNILTEYDSIAKAPTFSAITERVFQSKDKLDLHEVMKAEGKKYYKAASTCDKTKATIYLVRNPALMAYQVYCGCTKVTREDPINKGEASTYREIKKGNKEIWKNL